MKSIAVVGAIGAVALLVGATAFLVHKNRKRKEILFHDLKKKSLVSDYSIIKEKKGYVEIKNPLGSGVEFGNSINFLSHKFGRNFIDIEYITPKGLLKFLISPKVILKDSDFPKKITQYPEQIKLLANEFYFGIFQDSSPLILNQDITSSIIIEGQTRAGKTSLINSLILSAVQNNDHYQVLILDTKNSYSRLKQKKNFKIYDPRDFNELKEVSEEIKMLDRQIEQSKWLLEQVDNNIEEIRAKQKIDLPRTLIICEEAYEWLYADRIEKEEYLIKTEIIKNFKTIITKGRAFSCSIIFTTQAQHSDELPFKENLIQTKIYSQTSEALSREKVGSDILASDSLKNGRFYLLNPFKRGFFQSPFLTKNELFERLK